MSDKSSVKDKIGLRSKTYEEALDAERVRQFAESTGWQGEAHAIPFTFLTVFRAGERELFERLGFPLSKVLHAEQEYSWQSAASIGQRLSYSCVFSSCTEKISAKVNLRFMEFTTEFSSVPERQAVAQARMMIVVRDWTPEGAQ